MYRHTTPHPPSSLSALIPCGLSLRKQFMYCLDRRNQNALYAPETAKSVLLCLAWCLCFVNTIVVGAIPSMILTALPLLHDKAHGRTPSAAAIVHGSSSPTSQRLCNRAAPHFVVKVHAQSATVVKSQAPIQSESQWLSMVSGPTCR